MKCPKCGGNAELSNWGSIVDIDYADYHVECEKCGYHSMGSTDPQKAKEMFEKGIGMHYTNEQWLKQCTTEQLAEWLSNTFDLCGAGCSKCFVKELCFNEPLNKMPSDLIVKWLKQPHSFE